MAKRTLCIVLSVAGAAIVLTGLGILIWWLVELRHTFSIIVLEGEGIGDVEQTAAITRITRTGDMFWWFYPTLAPAAATRPILLWLDGVTGLPPSLLANFGMFGPYDFSLNRRSDSWINEYNLLFVDAPLGTGFSTAWRQGDVPRNLDDNADHILYSLEAFYSLHDEYKDAPLYIFGQGYGAQMALAVTLKLNEIVQDEDDRFTQNFKGVVLANGIVAPSLALTKLGFYLEEMGYIDARGRAAVESFSDNSNNFVNDGDLGHAFDHFLTLGEFVNDEAGMVAVNLEHIIEKLTREPEESRDIFGQRKYLRDALRTDLDFNEFMEETVAPALGLSISSYDSRRDAAVQAVRDSFMAPAIELVERVLNDTNIAVSIYNGNLDAVSNTPGQLEWVNNLRWSGQSAFSSARRTLVVNRLVEGYIRGTDRLTFYWLNAAGQSVPLDSPAAMRRVLQLITNTTLPTT